MTTNEKPQKKIVNLSIIITAHAEGILLHRTLASVRRGIRALSAQKNVNTEIIIHCDNPSPATSAYIEANKTTLKDTIIYTNSFKDLSASRNFAVQKANGKYVTFIDADDLVSEEWYVRAYNFLESHDFGAYVAHTESTVEFGGSNSLVIKHGEINKQTDTLLSTFANRWNSIIMAPRSLLLEEPYALNTPGYGYEDWHLNCRFIYRGIHNILMPKTAIFVRRKDSESEWLRQKTTYSVLKANPLFAFKNIRELQENNVGDGANTASTLRSAASANHITSNAIRLVKKIPTAEHYARKLYNLARNKPSTKNSVPEWLKREWLAMHTIDKQIFPAQVLLENLSIYDSLTPEHYQTGKAYKQIVDYTTHNSYDYILFVPWLIKGGADLYAINYANTIRKLHPAKRIVVLATLAHDSIWQTKLHKDIDFIPFGTITSGLPKAVQFRLLEHLVENSGAQYIHIVNSELGYDFATTYEPYLRATRKQLIATSFSQSTDSTGRIFGYSHTHVPKIYEQATLITTDNAAVADMWTNEYGFNRNKLLVHHLPVDTPKVTVPQRPLKAGQLRILWAARLSPEKQPELVSKIGRLVKDYDIVIDMYGQPDHDFDINSLVRVLPPNVCYKGPFDGFFSLPLDTYDAYLYTSLFDGMPNVVLEAASVQLPIVSAVVGGVPDFITDGKSGLLVHDLANAQEYADALLYLHKHPASLQKYSESLYKKLLQQHSDSSFEEEMKIFLQKLSVDN